MITTSAIRKAAILALSLCILLVFFACKHPKEKKTDSVDALLKRKPMPPVNLNQQVNQNISAYTIVDDIALDNSFDCAGVGIGGIKTDQYWRYEWLLKHSDNNDLRKLTFHANPVVRAYAFAALNEHHYDSLEDVLDLHIQDTASFRSMCGCIADFSNVNISFLYSMKNQLDKNKWKQYRAKVERTYPPKKWKTIMLMYRYFEK
ncbi:MAG: hypothetical protein JST86_15930 [Bacteroidetes bacterium]|nr:hypothetical protein [Bacteroidota bacterium]